MKTLVRCDWSAYGAKDGGIRLAIAVLDVPTWNVPKGRWPPSSDDTDIAEHPHVQNWFPIEFGGSTRNDPNEINAFKSNVVGSGSRPRV